MRPLPVTLQYWKKKKCLTVILHVKIKNSHGGLTLVLVMTPPLLLQETATGLQHCLQGTQAPVIVLLGSQQLPAQTKKCISSHTHTFSTGCSTMVREVEDNVSTKSVDFNRL